MSKYIFNIIDKKNNEKSNFCSLYLVVGQVKFYLYFLWGCKNTVFNNTLQQKIYLMAILIVTKIFNGDQVIIVASKVAFNSIYLYSVDYIYLYYIIPTKHNIATIILLPLNN